MTGPPPPEIVIYAAAGPSRQARAILGRHGLEFRELATLGAEYALGYCIGPTSIVGQRPTVSIAGTRIGGVRALRRLERLGVLEALKRGDGFPITTSQQRLTGRSTVRWLRARLHGDRTTPLRAQVTVQVDRAGRILELAANPRREPLTSTLTHPDG
jgi:hypothetical protein